MTAFVYLNTSKQVDDAEHVKVYAATDVVEKWFEENDPEGVAFEYEVLECTTYVVPELTRNADIKLNTRVSLQLIQTGIACRLVAQDLSPSTA
jgi:hypothetical protein